MSILSTAKKIFRRDQAAGSKQATAVAKSKSPTPNKSAGTAAGAVDKQTASVQSVLAGQIGLQVVVSERSMRLQEKNIVVFRVKVAATKREIEQAVHDQYGAQVLGIRTATFAPKTRRRGATSGQTNAWKKAFVTVTDVQKIATGP